VNAVGGERVNAARRDGSVKVWYSSAAVVRNSALSVSVTTLTEGPFVLDWVVVGARFCSEEDLLIEVLEMYFGVEKPLDGFDPGAC